MIGESSNPDAAAWAVSDRRPALVIVSFHPDGGPAPATIFGNGSRFPLLGELRACSPAGKLLIIGRHFTPEEALALHDLQVEGVASWRELRQTGVSSHVRALLDGVMIRNCAFEQALAGAVQPPAVSPVKPLSPREDQVVALIRQHLTDKEIGVKLGISRNTADNHVKHIAAKLGARDRIHLGTLLKERGLA